MKKIILHGSDRLKVFSGTGLIVDIAFRKLFLNSLSPEQLVTLKEHGIDESNLTFEIKEAA